MRRNRRSGRLSKPAVPKPAPDRLAWVARPEGYQLFRDNLLISLSGFLVGLLVRQTGTGGGSLMTPLLVLLFGVHPATAVGTDLLYASATKSVGTLVHGMNHTVNWRIVGRLAAGSVPATAATLLLLSQFDLNTGRAGAAISAILGVMLLLTALSLVFRRRFVAAVGPDHGAPNPAPGRPLYRSWSAFSWASW